MFPVIVMEVLVGMTIAEARAAAIVLAPIHHQHRYQRQQVEELCPAIVLIIPIK